MLARALALLAREQERIPAARVQFHLAARAPRRCRVAPRQPAMVQGNVATQLRAGQRHCRSAGGISARSD
jgi:hypothetical protein